MAVFYKTAGGDIYGGPDLESILAEVEADTGEKCSAAEMTELPPSAKIGITDENEQHTGEFDTLENCYSGPGAYCFAVENY